MIEYQVIGIPVDSPDAGLACRLLDAALRREPLARQALADLLAEHGEDSMSRLVRDQWNVLVRWNEGSVNLVQYSEDGEMQYVWQIGWHLPTAKSYQRLLDGDVPFAVHESIPLDDAF